MEGIPADNVTGGLGPENVEVSVQVYPGADVVDHVAGGTVLSPETVLKDELCLFFYTIGHLPIDR